MTPVTAASRWDRVNRVAIVALVLYAGWTVVITPAIPSSLHWAVLTGFVVLAVFGLRGSGVGRALAPVAMLVFWLLYVAFLPISTRWSPGSRTVTREVTALLMAAALSVALTLLTRGRRRLIEALPWAWAAVFVTTLGIALWELTTARHLIVTSTGRWLGQPRSPAATFFNPNNYACVLLVVSGLGMQYLSAGLRRRTRWVVAGGVVVALAVMASTSSRGAFLAVGANAVIAAHLWLVRRHGSGVLRRCYRTHPRPLWAALGAGIVVLGVAFLVPAIAARNPILEWIRPTDTRIAASDSLRLALTRAGLRFFVDRPLTGTGAGSFEVLLQRRTPPDVTTVTNMHNAFVELLSQYGLIVTAPFLLLLVACVVALVRPRPDAFGSEKPASVPSALLDRPGARAQLACLLIAIVVTGLLTSSALVWPMWWVMIAHAAALSWALGPEITWRARAGSRLRAP